MPNIEKTNHIISKTKKPLFCLITGASSGIGHAFAHVLAKNGHNLVVVARDKERLQKLAIDLYDKYKTKVHILIADLSQIESIDLISAFLQKENIHIDMLINNAGFGLYGSFYKTATAKEFEMVNLQINTTIALTKLVLPNMQKNRFGYILNVSSIYAFAPVPYQSIYGACKSFLLSFSSSLANELKEHGIKVTALCPGATQTEFRHRANVTIKADTIKNKLLQEKMHGITAQKVAEDSYKALMKGNLVCVTGFSNKLFAIITRFLPLALVSSIVSRINNVRGVNIQ